MKKISMQELADLLRDSEILSRLCQGGVDNWTFYDEALEGYEDFEEISDEELTKNYENCN